MPKIRRKSIENDFLLIFFCMQSEGVAQSSILMILRHPLLISHLIPLSCQCSRKVFPAPLNPAIHQKGKDILGKVVYDHIGFLIQGPGYAVDNYHLPALEVPYVVAVYL